MMELVASTYKIYSTLSSLAESERLPLDLPEQRTLRGRQENINFRRKGEIERKRTGLQPISATALSILRGRGGRHKFHEIPHRIPPNFKEFLKALYNIANRISIKGTNLICQYNKWRNGQRD